MTKDIPLISVLMAVYNGEKHLDKSIPAILSQSFSDFEFIIVDDGSTDNTADILKNYAAQDPRIRIISQDNTGLTRALNNGLNAARGAYIARQDADDLSYPDRLQQQYEFMETHPDTLLCGSNCDNLYPDDSKTQWGWKSDKNIADSIFYYTPFPHSTAFMRTETAQKLGGYDETFLTAQDTEFWMRFAKTGKVSMIKTPLLERYEDTTGSITAKRRGRQFYDGLRARWKHNKGLARCTALYYSLRGLLIGLLPRKIITLIYRLRHE